MSALLMAAAEASVLAAKLQRRALVSRCYVAGETELGDAGNALLDAPTDPWRAWEADALSALTGSPRAGEA
ncbi:MAG TPA: hypothetical protein VN033_08835 [Vulgatibacter sp.]|nr:hypothetical protein [Vulgatibacter sp.]